MKTPVKTSLQICECGYPILIVTFMRNISYLAGLLAFVALMGVGCAGPEQKLGRGLANTTEIFRLSEFQRSEEQAGIFEGTDVGLSTGFVRGIDRTLARTGV